MDDLNYSLVNTAIITQIFPKNNKGGETVIYIDKCKKFSRHNLGQERIFLMSTAAIYLVTKAKVHSKFLIVDLRYIIEALQSNEFILHFSNEKENVDIRIQMDKKVEMVDLLKMRFVNMCRERTLRVYGIPGKNLKEFKSKDANFSSEPAPKFRMPEKEIQCESEADATMKEEDSRQIEQKPNDFMFENRASISKKGINKFNSEDDNLIQHLKRMSDEMNDESDPIEDSFEQR